MIDKIIHPKPYVAKRSNNRKMTKCRAKDLKNEQKSIQSIPLFNEQGKTIGYRYIKH